MKQTQTEKFRELLREFETAVLVTHGQETHFHARPMAILQVEDNCDLWFITREESAKVHEVENDQRVQVICQAGRSSCISIAGRASLSHDRAKIRELWRPTHRIWFPQGVEDINIALIHVAGEHGEYWDNTGVNRITYTYEALKAVATGTVAEVKEGKQHGHVTLAHGD